MLIGLIADTHGLLRPEALAALRGCDHIVHAGDIGKPEVLAALKAVAPLTVVFGNVDIDKAWAIDLPKAVTVSLGGLKLYMTHEACDLPEPLPPGVQVVVTGHSHKPLIEQRNGVLHINPGSAGPRRFKLPICLALLSLEQGQASARLIDLTAPI
ncbi:phosphoesterase [Pseudomonas sp. M47T1]|uniref:metallophosphoesterase family protein n=1 Tax=unclassified Pseudomonas TaxID=196821 RepID=UPI0002607D41|nr:metallophosphoesterase family protein [Pseudomonas sp. M47T1]EIK97178.1 phosphoesterase [Pseudomonas sp. M47T1]